MIYNFKGGGGWLKGVKGLPQFWRSTFYLFIATAGIHLFSLALPLTLMQVYDRIIPYRAGGTLLWLAVGCFVAFFLEALLRYSRAWVSNWTAAKFEHLVSVSAFNHILDSQLAEYEQEEPGVYLDRLGAIGTLRQFYAGQIFQATLDLPFACLFLGAIWFLAGELVWFPVAVILSFLFLASVLKFGYVRARANQLDLEDRRFNYLFELLAGVHLVKSLTLEEQMLRRYERLQAGAAFSGDRVNFWSSLPANIGTFFSQISLFGVIGLGAKEVINGNLTIGALTASAMLAGRALAPIQSAAGFWLRLSEAKLAREQLSKIAILEQDTLENAPPFPADIEGYIEMENVSYRLREELPDLLTDQNLTIQPGEAIAILGDNANHTTALMMLLIGALRPRSGRVLIDDFELQEWDLAEMTGVVEYVPQSGVLFSGTLLENLTMFEPSRTAIAMDTSALLGLDEQVANLPMGYETMVKSQANNTLPTGLIQRLCFARALISRPRVLIFDRANAAMDQDSERMVCEVLAQLKGHCTLVIVSNQPALTNLGDRVFELKNATLAEKEKLTFSF